MTEPQVWTLIGVFAATMVGVVTVMTQLMMRTMTSIGAELGTRIESLRTHMDIRFTALEGRMDRIEGRMDRIENRMDRIELRVEGLDRDVQALTRRVFPDERLGGGLSG